jgi:glycosyltransferase involved in cell wall biosynthesis
MGNWPKVSIVTPTLNSQRTLKECLESIGHQNYPGDLEIIIADGGSSDGTIKIAESFGAKIVNNKLRTGEAGKAVGVKVAKGEIIAFVDSDNILPSVGWLKSLVEPYLLDDEIVATEPLYFSYRKKDLWLTRYFALLGMGDPISLFIGNYDRYSYITNKWTSLPIETKEHKSYFTFLLKEKFPTIGANGFLIRKSELEKYPIDNYLFDMDVLKFLASRKVVKVAKVKTGIVHLFSGNIATFVRKQRRRARDYFFFRKMGYRAKENDNLNVSLGVIRFILATVLILPLLIQMLTGYLRKRDIVWLFHPIACWITFIVYTWETLRFIFVKEEFNRSNWKQ